MGLITELKLVIREAVQETLRQERKDAEQAKAERVPTSITQGPEILTVAQVAQLLQVNEKTVRIWIQQRRLPAFEAGGWRIKRADLEVLMTRSPATEDLRTRIERDAAEILRLSRQRREKKGVG
jgi:excisionase family DNA binding protein